MNRFVVRLFKLPRYVLQNSKLIVWLNKPSNSKYTTYFKSLFAIYDFDGLVNLDCAWWPFDAMEFLQDYLKKIDSPKVFEWGSGASSIWLANRGCQVISVEHDLSWSLYLKTYTKFRQLPIEILTIAPRVNENAEFKSGKAGFKNLDFVDYVKVIDNYELFDLIVIDGRARLACLENALKHVKRDGIILFDNSNRRRYKLKNNFKNLHRLNFSGLTPASPFPTKSTVYFAK